MSRSHHTPNDDLASGGPSPDEAVRNGVSGGKTAHDAETPSEPFVISKRNPKNAAYLFSLLTGYVTAMTDEEAQAALPDCFQNVEIVLQPSQVSRNAPDADTDHTDTTELRGATS